MVWLEVAVTISILGILAYRRYSPEPPEGISDREQRKAVLRMWKIMMDVAALLEFLGVTTIINFLRALEKRDAPPRRFPASLLKVTDTTFDGVKVVVIEPLSVQKGSAEDAVPGLVLYHGGGYCMGSAGHGGVIQLIGHIALELGMVVVSVDYRLAPEHIFPAGLDDCVTATKYFMRNAQRYNVDPTRIGVGGPSAGGNLATVVAQRLVQEGHSPPLKCQVLVNPNTQSVVLGPSVYKYGPCEAISAWDIAYSCSLYVVGNRSKTAAVLRNSNRKTLQGTHFMNFLDPSLVDPTYTPLPPGKVVRREDVAADDELLTKVLHPHLSPLLAEEEDLKGLPPAFVAVSEFDALRDDGIFYAKRLERAGVKVKMIHYKDGYHCQLNDYKESETGQQMMEDVLAYLRENL